MMDSLTLALRLMDGSFLSLTLMDLHQIMTVSLMNRDSIELMTENRSNKRRSRRAPFVLIEVCAMSIEGFEVARGYGHSFSSWV